MEVLLHLMILCVCVLLLSSVINAYQKDMKQEERADDLLREAYREK